jgi:nucleolar protein 15
VNARGVVYIKHLPHGFFEKELREYFSQFGTVLRIRLARSPKTLRSKGYAFVEFRYPEVAEIAADAMNNYIMFKNVVKTFYIPPEQIKHDYFRSQIKKIRIDGEKTYTSRSIEARNALVAHNNQLMTDDDKKNMNFKISRK